MRKDDSLSGGVGNLLRLKLDWLLDQGVRFTQDAQMRRAVRGTNTTGLATGLIAAGFSALLVPASGWLAVPGFIGAALCLFAIALNGRGHHLAARFTIIGATSTGLAIYSGVYGATPSFHFGFLLPLGLSLVAFTKPELRFSLICTAVVLLITVSTMMYWHLFGPLAAPLDPFWGALLDTTGVLGIMVIISLATYSFLRHTLAIEEELASRNEELQLQQEELAAANEELQCQQEELAAANEELQCQQESLSASHGELQEHARSLQKANTKIQEESRQIEQAAQHTSEFLANMSHELRTPLNSMLLLSRMLGENQEGNLNSEQVESAKIVHEAGQSLLALLNDILDMAKVEAGKVSIHPEQISLAAFTTDLERRYRPLAEEKGLQLEVERTGRMQDLVEMDDMRVRQIITNLISNALKFTHSGVIRVCVNQTSAAEDPKVQIAVSDTGIGIASDKLEHVFGKFQQADGSTTRNYGGTGLGLSLSRKLAELMGGDLTVVSELGTGSTFTLTLPLRAIEAVPNPDLAAASSFGRRADHTPDIPQSQLESSRRRLSGKTVIIVDDDMRNVFSLSRVLQHLGVQVVKTAGGEACLKALDEAVAVDAVLTDIMMPGMDGYELIGRIRKHPKKSRIPVIALTAKAMRGDREEVLRAGADAYIAKPIDLSVLVETLESFVGTTEVFFGADPSISV